MFSGMTKPIPATSEAIETKPCAMCAEPIRVAARVCPYCRRFQPRWPKLTEWMALLPLLALGILFVGGVAWISHIFSRGRDFEPFRNQIVVQTSDMHFGRMTNGNYISAIGSLHNESPYAWKEIRLEVQYYDKDGRLIDTRAESSYGEVLPAGGTQTFRIRALADKPEPSYASHKVFVRSAKDSRKWP